MTIARTATTTTTTTTPTTTTTWHCIVAFVVYHCWYNCYVCYHCSCCYHCYCQYCYCCNYSYCSYCCSGLLTIIHCQYCFHCRLGCLLFVVGYNNSCNNNCHHCCFLYNQHKLWPVVNKQQIMTNCWLSNYNDLFSQPTIMSNC